MPYRFKESGSEDVQQITATFTTRRNDTNQIISTSSSTHNLGVIFQTMKGFAIPNFHARQRAGELLPHTPYFKMSLSGRVVSASYEYTTPYSGSITKTNRNDGEHSDWQNSLLFVSRDDLSANIPDATELAAELQRAASAIASKGHDTLTFLAELRKVRQMFLRAIKKLLTLDFPKDLKGFSSNWLEARYGWRTLLYDLESLNSAILEFDPKRKRYSEKQGSSYSLQLDHSYDQVASAYTTTRNIYDEVNVSLRGSMSADVSPNRFNLNPVRTAWELVPYSFVLDWIINIGQALAAMEFVTLTSQRFGSVGYKITVDRDFSKYTHSYKSGYSGSVTCEAISKGIMSDRDPEDVSLIPITRLRLDEFKVIDLIALVYQRFK